MIIIIIDLSINYLFHRLDFSNSSRSFNPFLPCSDSTVNKYSVQSEIFVIYV